MDAEHTRGAGKEPLMVELLVHGVVGILAFAALYVIGLGVVRGGGGDETKDIGLD